MTAPSIFLMALEARAPVELGAGLLARPLLRFAPKGDGHPVIVFPGLGASDFSTKPLRNFLTQRGFAPVGWHQGFNLGPHDKNHNGVLERCLQQVSDLHAQTGRKVSLVGWSLGGLFAREVAKVVPECVRSVITMGTPFAGTPRATNAWRIYEFVSGDHMQHNDDYRFLSHPPPVPTTSIFSRSDGVVAWRASVQAPTDGYQTENIELEASHLGVGVTPLTLYAVADRLAQPEGSWQPFVRSGWKWLAYRNPERIDCLAFLR